MAKHRYFVSYLFYTDIQLFVSDSQVVLDNPVRSLGDIEEMRSVIRSLRSDCDSEIVILNWRKFDD